MHASGNCAVLATVDDGRGHEVCCRGPAARTRSGCSRGFRRSSRSCVRAAHPGESAGSDTDRTRRPNADSEAARERFYGKIDTKLLDRAKEHETQRFTLLFPAALDADVKPGDLINYKLVGYMRSAGNERRMSRASRLAV